jgi:hypothetical protein
MSFEVITPAHIEAGADIARRGAELANRARSFGNIVMSRETSLVGGMHALEVAGTVKSQQFEVIGDAVNLLTSVLDTDKETNDAEGRARTVVGRIISSNGKLDHSDADSLVAGTLFGLLPTEEEAK